MQKSFWWRQCSDRNTISLSPYLHTPPPFSPSLISLMVAVDVKHHVYLLSLQFSSAQDGFYALRQQLEAQIDAPIQPVRTKPAFTHTRQQQRQRRKSNEEEVMRNSLVQKKQDTQNDPPLTRPSPFFLSFNIRLMHSFQAQSRPRLNIYLQALPGH